MGSSKNGPTVVAALALVSVVFGLIALAPPGGAGQAGPAVAIEPLTGALEGVCDGGVLTLVVTNPNPVEAIVSDQGTVLGAAAADTTTPFPGVSSGPFTATILGDPVDLAVSTPSCGPDDVDPDDITRVDPIVAEPQFTG